MLKNHFLLFFERRRNTNTQKNIKKLLTFPYTAKAEAVAQRYSQKGFCVKINFEKNNIASTQNNIVTVSCIIRIDPAVPRGVMCRVAIVKNAIFELFVSIFASKNRAMLVREDETTAPNRTANSELPRIDVKNFIHQATMPG